MRLLITGASGYIGQRLVAMATAHGHAVTVLGRKPAVDAKLFPWRLGETVPAAALVGTEAVIHLAHDWRADADGQDSNGDATVALARQALATGVGRFVFASSTSSREEAPNVYGRSKHASEKRLAALPGAAGPIVSARIGVVYGGAPAGPYGLMRRIAALSPVLPMVGLEREVQPIHLDEVCAALLTLAARQDLPQDCYIVAGRAMRFGNWLKLLRRAQGGKSLLLIPMPVSLMLMACDLTRLMPGLPTIGRERVLGLTAAAPMPSGPSLQALGLTPGDPLTLLQGEQGAAEAEVLLRYLNGAPTPAMMRALTDGLARAGLVPLGLSPWMLRHPGLLALAEPPANRRANPLAQALYLAAQVIEAYRPPARCPTFLEVASLLLRDLVTWPLRRIAMWRRR